DPAEAGQPRGEVRVEGRQFYWQFEYPGGVISVNRLMLPAGRVTELEIVAPEHDVIHSFWVPTLAGKRDAVPGDATKMKVRPDAPGLHRIVCGEFCGIQHAAMYGQVEVVTGEEFDRWLEAQQTEQEEPSAELGEATFEAACATCHGVQGEGLIGPPLAGSPIVEQAEAVEEVVREGRGAMPAVGEGWSDVQMRSLLQYVSRELGGEGGGAGGGEG
ncbi:MAG: c-type cytochrome, partial [Thermoleophilia bacterium]|nr:c-type cytochrome [Thermoleophilia bacterium]